MPISGTSTATVSNNDLTNSGTGVSVGLDNDGVTLLDNDVSNVGTDFNFRNLTGDVSFDVGAAVAALTTGFATNDPIVVLTGSGNDTVIGTPRPQDVFGLQAFGASDGLAVSKPMSEMTRAAWASAPNTPPTTAPMAP